LDYKDYVRKNEAVYRPAEVDLLMGDSTKASNILQWEPTVKFAGLVKEMVLADLESLSSSRYRAPLVTVSGQ
jgi:GDPmannose 4,6-dehydratase